MLVDIADRKKRRGIIKKMIRDGSYFEDAIRWYTAKYSSEAVLRASFFIASMIISTGFAVMVHTARQNFVSVTVPFPIYAKDQVNFFPLIKPLAQNGEDLEPAIVKYFISKYLVLRESYSPIDFLDENRAIMYQKVKALSTHRVYREYQEYIDPDVNPKSPILEYKKQSQRIIKITDVKIRTIQRQAISAHVEYNAIVRCDGVEDVVVPFAADIGFIMSDVDHVLYQRQELYFLVTHYDTYKLSK